MTYRDQNFPCLTWEFEVEAPDEERAIMRAGMARGDFGQFEAMWFGHWIKRLHNWERESVTDVTREG